MREISDNARAICNLISQGHSVQSAATELGLEKGMFYYELRFSQELVDLYIRARETRAHHRFEEYQDIEDKASQGILDAQTARFMLESLKWRTAKEQPRVYGEKIAHEHTGNITLSSLVESSLAVTDQSKEIIDLEPLPLDKGKEFI